MTDLECPDPPQAPRKLSPIPQTASSISNRKGHRFFEPKQHKATANADEGNSAPYLQLRAGVLFEKPLVREIFEKVGKECIEKIETSYFRVEPSLSRPPEALAAANPLFWSAKPEH